MNMTTSNFKPREKIIYVRPEWIKVQDLPKVFVGVGKQTCERFARLMYDNDDFSDGVMKPTTKLTLVEYDRFVEFLKYMDDTKFK